MRWEPHSGGGRRRSEWIDGMADRGATMVCTSFPLVHARNHNTSSNSNSTSVANDNKSLIFTCCAYCRPLQCLRNWIYHRAWFDMLFITIENRKNIPSKNFPLRFHFGKCISWFLFCVLISVHIRCCSKFLCCCTVLFLRCEKLCNKARKKFSGQIFSYAPRAHSRLLLGIFLVY